MSPLQADILLWYFSRGNDYRDGDFQAPAVRAAIDSFRDHDGMLEESRDGVRTYQLTDDARKRVEAMLSDPSPIPIRLNCPSCGMLHVDEGEFATKPHHTHSCQGCGMTWRPAVQATVGVQFLPGFKNQ